MLEAQDNSLSSSSDRWWQQCSELDHVTEEAYQHRQICYSLTAAML